MRRLSFNARWARRVATTLGSALFLSGCLGGQSGGETDHDIGQPEAPAACACVPPGVHPVHARVNRLAGGCAELVVVERLSETSTDEYLPLNVGDTFGGVVTPLCVGGPDVAVGDDVFALFTRGTQDGATCPEYRACSIDRCGDPNDLASTTVSGECTARQAQDPQVDCQETAVSDEALAEYDRCDTECLEQTRSLCETRAGDTQLGGTVSVAPWSNGEVSFFWAGEQRSESSSELVDPECPTRHHELWVDFSEHHSPNAPPVTDGRDVASAPPAPPPMPMCPIPPQP